MTESVDPGEPATPEGGGFRKLSEREIHRASVITMAEGEFAAPDGTRMTRELIRHPGAVSVVPVDGDEVVLVRQYRAAIEADLLEIPAGKRDVEGEAPTLTAMRELEEEVGLVAGKLVTLARFYNSAGFSDEYSHVYMATELRPGTVDRDGVEERWMTVERVPLDDVPDLIKRGEIEDAKTIIGLLLALRRLGR